MNVCQILTVSNIIIGIIFFILVFFRKMNSGVKIVLLFLILSLIVYPVFGVSGFQFSDFINITARFFIQPILLVIPTSFYLLLRWLILPDYEWSASDLKLFMPYLLVIVINTLVVTYFSIDNIDVFSKEDGIGSSSSYKSFSMISTSLTIILYIIQLVFYGVVMVFLIIKKGKKRKFDTDGGIILFYRNLWFFYIIYLLFAIFTIKEYRSIENSFISSSVLVISTISILFSGIFVLNTSSVHEKT